MSDRYVRGLITANPPADPDPALGSAASGMWTMEQYYALQKQGKWPTKDPYFNQTVLLLHGDGGVSGATNNGGDPTYLAFADNSDNDFPITVNGNARGDNSSPFQVGEGEWSNYFDGESQSYLNTPSTGQFAPTGDFTIAWWYYPVVFQTSVMLANYTGNNSTDWSFETDSTGDLNIYLNGSTLRITGSSVLNLNDWNYIVVSRSGSTVTAYCNGSPVNTYNFGTGTFGSANKLIRIGAGSAGTNNAEGYISNVYLLDGTALDGTVPTTPYSNASGVELLTCQSNRFVDNSTSPNAITVNGGVKVQPFNPFTTDYNTVDGSGYFDGAGDYLTLTDTNNDLDLGGVQASVDFWAYVPDSTVQYNAIQKGNSNSYNLTDGFSYSLAQSSSTWAFFYNNAGSGASISGTAPAPNQWTHVCAATDTSNNIALFINGTRVATASNAISKPTTRTGIKIGEALSNNGDWLGYMANLRFLTGANAYDPTDTTITIPTASPTNVSGTELLTVQYQGAVRNGGFIDSSPNDFLITANGNTTQGTFSPFSVGAGRWSNYFDGTDDYLSIADSSDFDFGSGQFCVECWFYFVSREDYGSVIGQWASSNKAFKFGFTTTDALTFTYSTNGSNETDLAQTGTLSRNAWHHIVACRSGTGTNEFAIFVDGTRVHNSTLSATFYNSAAILGVGGDATGSCVGGYISNVRLVKGASVYDPTLTTITVPTNPLTAISSTVLLTAQSNRFVDNNTQVAAKTIGLNSTPKVTPFSPFAPTAAYSASVNGGSGYFDGTGDYLSIADNAALDVGTGDFELSCWVYPTAYNTSNTIFAKGTNNIIFFYDSSGILKISQYGVANRVTASTGPALNQWSHVAASRVSGTTKLFLNGTEVGSASDTSDYDSAVAAQIGEDPNNSTQKVTGYIAGFRLVKGSGVTSVTQPTSPPTAISGTSILLNFTNAGIFDNTGKNNLETVGNAQIDTTTKKYGTGSMEVNGSSGYLTAPDNVEYDFGTADFTFECWLYATATNGEGTLFCVAVSNGIHIFVNRTGQFGIGKIGTASGLINFGSSPALNQWNHIAVSRASGTTYGFINGVLIGSSADSNDYVSGGKPSIGIISTSTGNNVVGFIDDLRITKGVARYTSNFTPQTSQWQDQ